MRWCFPVDAMGMAGVMYVPIVPCRFTRRIGGFGNASVCDKQASVRGSAINVSYWPSVIRRDATVRSLSGGKADIEPDLWVHC